MQAQKFRKDGKKGDLNISKRVLIIALIDLICYELCMNT